MTSFSKSDNFFLSYADSAYIISIYQSREAWNPHAPAEGGMRRNSREVALLQGASGSCRRGLHYEELLSCFARFS
jgi:hypothetical protein